MMSREDLRSKLVKVHEEKGIAYTWFAKQLGVHRNNISYFIRNKREISSNLANRLERILESV